MTRKEQIRTAAEEKTRGVGGNWEHIRKGAELWFIRGAIWADSHPRWYDAQGDNVPEYGREVIVIRRNGMICYGHRPNPKEYVIVEGKKCFAKTYDKNDWNIPDIALWLDVEIPEELIDKITTEYYKENKLTPRKEE